MEGQGAQIVLMILVGTYDNSLNLDFFIVNDTKIRREIGLCVEIIRQSEILVCKFQVGDSVQTVDAQDIVFDAECQHIPAFLKHLDAIGCNRECVAVSVVKVLVGNFYDSGFLHGFQYVLKEISA